MSSGTSDLYLIDPSSTGVTSLTRDRAFESQAGLVARRKANRLRRELRTEPGCLCDEHGCDRTQEPHGKPGRRPPSGVWSPDGTKIAFVSDRSGNDDVHLMEVDGSGLTNLTNHPSARTTRRLGSDVKIAFRSFRAGNGDVYVMNGWERSDAADRQPGV